MVWRWWLETRIPNNQWSNIKIEMVPNWNICHLKFSSGNLFPGILRKKLGKGQESAVFFALKWLRLSLFDTPFGLLNSSRNQRNQPVLPTTETGSPNTSGSLCCRAFPAPDQTPGQPKKKDPPTFFWRSQKAEPWSWWPNFWISFWLMKSHEQKWWNLNEEIHLQVARDTTHQTLHPSFDYQNSSPPKYCWRFRNGKVNRLICIKTL